MCCLFFLLPALSGLFLSAALLSLINRGPAGGVAKIQFFNKLTLSHSHVRHLAQP